MTDLIVDKLVFKDVQLTATNDDQYFVFEDILYQVSSHSRSEFQTEWTSLQLFHSR